jgi:UDP-N-acetylmuramoyl-L-alanyl-D-glutamate--2,6-diaminopimelate ligase
MKLKKLIKDCPQIVVKGSKEIEITGISAFSKWVSPGNLFVSKNGETPGGAKYLQDALAAGAIAVLSDLYNPFLPVTQLIHPKIDEIEAQIAKRYYEHADEKLFLVGITGTNGKTTTSYLVKHLFDQMEKPCGLIGTIECLVGKNTLPSNYTTPDLVTNLKFFHEMKRQGMCAAVMEVSSHGLEQGRVRTLDFNAAIFTQLTQDHLDYHQTMEAYAASKSKLFSQLKKGGVAIVNSDDPWTATMIKECQARIFTYGINHSADVRASEIVLSPQGMSFHVEYQGSVTKFHSPLIGRFNVYNCLATIALGLSQGFGIDKIAEAIHSFKTVSGRVERVPNAKGLNIFVDYAHTDDALKNVLETLRELKRGRIITVFGCGGDRDRGKRSKMGRVAEELSDQVVITSDNPRAENPEAIAQEILTGLQHPHKAEVELDRKEAIRKAIALATPNDLILIAGKGHETYQIFQHQTISFDDRLVAQESCE